MSGYHTLNCQAILMTTGGTPSTGNAVFTLEDTYALGITAPAALNGTMTVYVEPTSSGTGYTSLLSGGAVITLTAGQAIVVSPFPYKQLTLVGSVEEATPRTFLVTRTVLV